MAASRGAWWKYPLGGLAVLYLLGVAVGAAIEAGRTDGWLGVVAMLMLHGAGLAGGALALRRERMALLMLCVAALTGLAADILAAYWGLSLLFMVAWVAPFRLSLVRTGGYLVVLLAGFFGTSLIGALPASAAYGIAAGLCWTTLLAVMVHQLSATRCQAEAVAAARSGEAVLAERQRVAREIHDVLAHSLSAQVVHLEGTRMLLDHGCDPGQVRDRVIKACDLARTGLEETKRAVEALRGDQAPLVTELEILVAQFRVATGRPCSLLVSGDPDHLPPEIRLAVLRTAQEALTNVRKHAPEAEVSVALRDAAGWCELDVRDTGGGGTDAATPGGYGLVGMRERAELIGGRLTAGPDGSGFRVRLRVPA